MIPQDMVLLPKVYSTLPVCILHVVNNDTLEQVPKVFQKVVPYRYSKNKVGAKFLLSNQQNDTENPALSWNFRSQIFFKSQIYVFSIHMTEENDIGVSTLRSYILDTKRKYYIIKHQILHIIKNSDEAKRFSSFIQIILKENNNFVSY